VKKEGLYAGGQELCTRIMALLRRRREVHEQLQRLIALDRRRAIFTPPKQEELEGILASIIPPAFLRTMDSAMLEDCDRYLRSLQIRLERLHANPAKDEAKATRIRPHLHHLADLAQRLPVPLPDELRPLVEEYRTMIEEFRISLFSPEIKTKMVVSAKKLEQQWQAIHQLC